MPCGGVIPAKRVIYVVGSRSSGAGDAAGIVDSMPGIAVESFESGEATLAAAAGRPPDLVIVGEALSDMDSVDFIRRVRGRDGGGFVPIVLIIDGPTREMIAAAIEAGTTEFLRRSWNDLVLEARCHNLLKLADTLGELQQANRLQWMANEELRRANEELRVLARTDALTGALNRRAFFEAVDVELARMRRSRQPLAVLMMDLDHFKCVNDEYGHDVGDAALRAFTTHCVANLRPTDQFGRVGGEEFACLLPEIDRDGAIALAERLRRGLGSVSVSTVAGLLYLSVSIGVAVADPDDSRGAVLRRADRALYDAKDRGRNCTVHT